MKITAGLPAKYIITLPDHSAADGWTLSGQLTDADGTYSLTSSLFTASATEWTLKIPSATTADYEAGDCMLYIVATRGTDEELVFQEASGIVALGTVSHNQEMVTAIRELIKGRTAKAYESLTTPEGESITLIPPADLVDWLSYYEKCLAGELSGNRRGSRVGTVQMGFK